MDVCKFKNQFFRHSLLLCACAVAAAQTHAFDVTFTDEAAVLNLDYFGETFGQSWGDYDGDGYADLYFSNHGFQVEVFHNEAGVGFTNINDQITTDFTGDIHAGAWGDFDNDGDRDLLFVEGASGGQLPSPNRLLVNTNGTFVDQAAEWNLEQEFARSRTPGWFDWNNDGLLDVSLSNFPNFSGVGPSAVFTRIGNMFANENDNSGYDPEFSNNFAVLIKTNTVAEPVLAVNTVFDFSEGIYDMAQLPFIDLTPILAVPVIAGAWDFAAADFDGDLDQEIFFPRQRELSEVATIDDNNIQLTFWGFDDIEHGITFETPEPVNFDIGPSWRVPLSRIYIGATGYHPDSLNFTLDATDPAVQGTPDHNPSFTRIYIYFDTVENEWHVDGTDRIRGTMKISSTGVITGTEMFGLTSETGGRTAFLLDETEAGYANVAAARGLAEPFPCMSIAVEDFDNDMDVDIYMSCAGAAANLPNVLLENDGNGNFTSVDGSAGAVGSIYGRSDTAATADFNNDGFMDILVTNGFGTGPTAPGTTELFVNGGNDNHWIHIDLEGVTVNRDGIGAWVVLTAGGKSQSRLQDNGTKRYGQDDQRIHFGLGDNETIEEISIRWPGGQMQTLTNIAADQILRVVQEIDSDGDGVMDDSDNCREVANPNQIDADADGFGNVCDTDLNNDLVTNFVDISLFSAQFLSSDPVADFNSDGAVNFLDAAVLTDYFLLPPGP
ncbi:MAG: FG-GAP-like repeat-containing protein [Gammaproteobacteria bacterium]